MVRQGAVDGFLHRFTQEALAELLAQQCHWHLALAETLHLDFGLCFFQLFFDFRVQLGSRHGNGITALEAFVQGLGDLHILSFFPTMVRVEGLEPPRLAAPEPKSGASTNFATPASRTGSAAPARRRM